MNADRPSLGQDGRNFPVIETISAIILASEQGAGCERPKNAPDLG